jgi:hypothetical protein
MLNDRHLKVRMQEKNKDNRFFGLFETFTFSFKKTRVKLIDNQKFDRFKGQKRRDQKKSNPTIA